MNDKKTKLKEQKKTITIVLLLAALALLLTSFFIRNNETQKLVRLMGFGLLLATLIFRLFKGEFGYKPTREEIEEKMFGKDKSEN
jgi:uncharacterized membrane protein YwaF